MQDLESGKDKIKKICDILENETLHPAKVEAQRIVEVAQEEASSLIREAEAKAATVKQESEKALEKERALFENSLKQAGAQAIEALRQNVEKHLFNEALSHWVATQAIDPKLLAQLITALAQAVEKEGISADFSAVIPKTVQPEQVNALLAKEVLDKLKEKSVTVAEFVGGAQLQLHDQKLTLDVSDEALKELIGSYVRRDFRELLFTSES